MSRERHLWRVTIVKADGYTFTRYRLAEKGAEALRARWSEPQEYPGVGYGDDGTYIDAARSVTVEKSKEVVWS